MKCCERDIDNDGNCDIHAEPNLTRIEAERIRQELHSTYGRSCTNIYCRADHAERQIDTGGELKPLRVDDGHMVTIRVFIADADPTMESP